MSNHLANETSPYLLQHAANPVDWYPWGAEALARAVADDKPILLSIGYAACHWCHVMEHESFENAATAAVMNEHFISIKVDREERPDLDAIYMQAVQAMTGHGGWPMTVFLTPGCEPFYGGTYFPPVERHGMPSFTRVLLAISDSYRNRRDSVNKTTRQLREYFDSGSRLGSTDGVLDRPVLVDAYRALAAQYDAARGGFGGAPKFPPSMSLDFLLRYWARTGTEFALDIAVRSFRAMSRGGIYDQVGGGLHRYSVDERWLVPHFEKMLYDNALFARLGVHLWQATGDDEVQRVTRETLAWLARELTSPDGGFYSSLDADSEGHEGTFYVWNDDALTALLGHDAEVVLRLRGQARRGAAALDVDDDQGQLGHDGEIDRFALEGDARAAGAGDAEGAGRLGAVEDVRYGGFRQAAVLGDVAHADRGFAARLAVFLGHVQNLAQDRPPGHGESHTDTSR